MKIEEKDDDLERALHKARRVKQKEDVISDLLAKTEIKPEPDDNADNCAIILNSTAEFCRTLGNSQQTIEKKTIYNIFVWFRRHSNLR